jgi:hypothetical protein
MTWRSGDTSREIYLRLDSNSRPLPNDMSGNAPAVSVFPFQLNSPLNAQFIRGRLRPTFRRRLWLKFKPATLTVSRSPLRLSCI